MKNKSNRIVLAILAALVISSSLTACAQMNKTHSAAASQVLYKDDAAFPESEEASPMYEPEVEPTTKVAVNSGGAASPVIQNIIPQEANAKIIYTGRLQMQTLDFDKLMQNLNKAIADYKGYVENSGISGGNDSNGYYTNKHANLAVRIPSATMNEFLELVGTLGNVMDSSMDTENITLKYADIEARKTALTVEYERLMELLGTAKDLEAVIALEARLSEVRYQLDEFSSTLRTYDSLVDYATIHLSIDEVRKITSTGAVTLGERISTGFSNTLYSMKVFAENMLVFLIVNSPILIILAVIIVAIVLISRKYNRKMRKKFSYSVPPSAGSADSLIYPAEKASAKNGEGKEDLENQPEKK